MIIIRAVLISGLLSLAAPLAVASAVSEQLLKLTPSDGAPLDSFGAAVAISGTTAIIGAPGDGDMGVDSGAVYLFDLTSGTQLAKLTAGDGMDGDGFGSAVASSGSLIVVGAPGDDDGGLNAGSAYVFDIATGLQLAKLIPSGIETNDFFGMAIDVSGDSAIVGARGDDDFGSHSGAAYLFDVGSGMQRCKLNASDASTNDFFGAAVAIDGNFAIVGAGRANGNGASSGAAYLFDVSTGLEIAKLLPADNSANDVFGGSVAIDGDTVLVSASGDDEFGDGSGSVYVYDAITTKPRWKLTPNDGAALDRFGSSVHLSGHIAVVGAYLADNQYENAGAAYLFDTRTGEQIGKLTATDSAVGDRFGLAVAVEGQRVLVGAPLDDDNGTLSGAAYVFQSPIPEPSTVALLAVAIAVVAINVAYSTGPNRRATFSANR